MQERMPRRCSFSIWVCPFFLGAGISPSPLSFKKKINQGKITQRHHQQQCGIWWISLDIGKAAQDETVFGRVQKNIQQMSFLCTGYPQAFRQNEYEAIEKLPTRLKYRVIFSQLLLGYHWLKWDYFQFQQKFISTTVLKAIYQKVTTLTGNLRQESWRMSIKRAYQTWYSGRKT